MGNINVVEILSYGIIGLGFLLALLSYRLLTREQSLKEPRSNMIRAIYVFMTFSILLCVIGFVSEFYKQRDDRPQSEENSIQSPLPHREIRFKLRTFIEEGNKLLSLNGEHLASSYAQWHKRCLVFLQTIESKNDVKFDFTNEYMRDSSGGYAPKTDEQFRICINAGIGILKGELDIYE